LATTTNGDRAAFGSTPILSNKKRIEETANSDWRGKDYVDSKRAGGLKKGQFAGSMRFDSLTGPDLMRRARWYKMSIFAAKILSHLFAEVKLPRCVI